MPFSLNRKSILTLLVYASFLARCNRQAFGSSHQGISHLKTAPNPDTLCFNSNAMPPHQL